MGSLYGNFKGFDDAFCKLLEVAQNSTNSNTIIDTINSNTSNEVTKNSTNTLNEQKIDLQVNRSQLNVKISQQLQLVEEQEGLVLRGSNVVSSSYGEISVQEKQEIQEEESVLGCLLELQNRQKDEQIGRFGTMQCGEKMQKRKSQVVTLNQRKPKRLKQSINRQRSSSNFVQAIQQWRKLVNREDRILGNLYESAFGSYLGNVDDVEEQYKIYKGNYLHTHNTGFHVQIGSSQLQNSRQYMEDRHICVPNLQLPYQDENMKCAYAGVFDGHNGAHVADIGVQGIFETILQNNVHRLSDGCCTDACRDGIEQISHLIKQSFLQVDDQIIDLCIENEWRGGSTALTALFLGQQMYIANCGDSRAVLCNSGTAVRVTTDHKPNLLKERERIQSNGGKIVCQTKKNYRVAIETEGGMMSGLSLSRALGDYQFKYPKKLIECEPDIHHRKIEDGDQFLILATDGLWDTLTDQQAVDIVQDIMYNKYLHMSIQQRLELAAEECQNAAVQNGSLDNITVVVISFCRK